MDEARQRDVWELCCAAARLGYKRADNETFEEVVLQYGRHYNVSEEEVDAVCKLNPRQVFYGAEAGP